MSDVSDFQLHCSRCQVFSTFEMLTLLRHKERCGQPTRPTKRRKAAHEMRPPRPRALRPASGTALTPGTPPQVRQKKETA